MDDLGGDVLCVEISALHGKNVDELKVAGFFKYIRLLVLVFLIVIEISGIYQGFNNEMKLFFRKQSCCKLKI